MSNLKELWQKKTLLEIESMIIEHKRNIGAEKDLTTLHRLTSELVVLQELRDQKQRESGRNMIHKSDKSSTKPELKSFDDYVKNKK